MNDILKLWEAWEEANEAYFEDEDNEEKRVAMEEAENALASEIRGIFNADMRTMKTLLNAKKSEVKAKIGL